MESSLQESLWFMAGLLLGMPAGLLAGLYLAWAAIDSLWSANARLRCRLNLNERVRSAMLAGLEVIREGRPEGMLQTMLEAWELNHPDTERNQS